MATPRGSPWPRRCTATRACGAWAQDLGPEGGVARQYRGLQAEFGPRRVLDTPISENAIMGAAVGAAMTGTRPVVELRFADFGLCATDEIVNQAAKIRFMYGGQARVPLVIRMAIGFRFGIAAQHSQSTEAFWTHVPGLVVVAPATPADNYGLLKSAIRLDDPVAYLEHKELWTLEGDLPPEGAPDDGAVPIGEAAVVREGGDVTIVTWSSGRHAALNAADMLAEEGIDAEVIDLRTLWPWDRERVFASLEKTRACVVAHEAVQVSGFGAEIAAVLQDAFFGRLDGPIGRVAGVRAPVPYSKPLEDAVRLTPERIAAGARALRGSGASQRTRK